MTDLTRRSFLKVVGGVGASFALGSFATIACAADREDKATFAPNAFVKIDPDGTITITVARSDMGQGVRTSLAMLLAEELNADWHKVRVEQAPANPEIYGGQGTGGSSSIRGSYGRLRKLGATTRAMLIAAAAKTMSVDASSLTTANGAVIHKATGRSMPYGELTSVAATMPVPENVQPKEKADFKIIGKATSRVDNPNVVTGKAVYGLDVKVDGMVYAVLERPAVFGSSLEAVDDADTKKIPGVLDVVKVAGGVAVIATNTWSALKGRDALKITWSDSPHKDLDSKKVYETLKAAAIEHLPMPDGAKVVEAEFQLPYLAHATMEPMNAVADVRDGKCVIWAGTQTPDGAQRQVARALGIDASQVTLNVTLLGGGFGRRLGNDYILEAVQISQAIKKPVKLTWSREDDMKHDNYRPACYHTVRAAVDGSGNPVGWSHQAIQSGGRGGAPKFGGANMQYDIPNAGMVFTSAQLPVSTGAWRSVENTLLNVVNECVIDEMAHAAGQDPLQFRLKMLKDGRLKKVVETAAERAGWGTALPKGTGRGIACFAGYGSYAAHVVELSVRGSEIKLNRVVAVIDCGLAINPKGVEAQLQGAVTDGLSTAIRAAITIEKGSVAQHSWSDYHWMTMDAMPKIETVILENGDSPGGMGEPGYPSVSPAVANAIFAATGKRVRKFPIRVEELV